MAVQITMYLNEADQWNHRPLHLEILKYLRDQQIVTAAVFHAFAGYNGLGRVHTAGLVDAGGRLPVVLTFVDHKEHVDRVLPKIKEMAKGRIIIYDPEVNIVQGLHDHRCEPIGHQAA